MPTTVLHSQNDLDACRRMKTHVKLLYSAFKTHISHVLFGTVVNTVSTSCSIHSSSFLDATAEAAVCLNVLVNTLVYLLSELFCIHLHAQYMK